MARCATAHAANAAGKSNEVIHIMPALMTIAEFLRAYSLSRSTFYRLRDRGDIPFVHIGRAVRIRREDAEAWVASLTCAANDA